MTEVVLRGLGKTYPGAADAAVEGLTLTLDSGALTVLLGPSGCGKSTVMQMIAGVLAPSVGDVLFDGASVRDVPAEARGAVMVFQNALLFGHMSVGQNVGFGLRMRGVARAEVTERVQRMLDLVQLPGFGARRPAELSGGQQQRVALARALIVAPRVLLLDEPLSSLDAHLRGDMRDLIRRVQRDMGITTLLVTHDQAEAVMLADRVALMMDGRLCQVGAPSAFYAQPASVRVARFFGGCNFYAGDAADSVFRCGLGMLTIPVGLARGAGLLTIRPEAVRLGTGGANSMVAQVMDKVFWGTQVQVTLRVGEDVITALWPPDTSQDVAVGQTVTITLPPAALWLLPQGAQGVSDKAEQLGPAIGHEGGT